MAEILLTIIYYGILGPVQWMMKLAGIKPLDCSPGGESCWVEIPEGHRLHQCRGAFRCEEEQS